MRPPISWLRAVAMTLVSVLAAASCSAQPTIVDAGGTEVAWSTDNALHKVVFAGSAPVRDKIEPPDNGTLLDERTDRGDEPEKPPTVSVESEETTLDGGMNRGGRRDVPTDQTDDDPIETDAEDDANAEEVGQSDAELEDDADTAEEDSEDDADPAEDDADPAEDSQSDADFEDQSDRAGEENNNAPTFEADLFGSGLVDFSVTNDDLACDAQVLERYDNIDSVVAHAVVDGVLGATCSGTVDNRLLYAWQIVTAITSDEYLDQIGLFAGYESVERSRTTLAFVVPPAIEGELFQISVNLERSGNRDEFPLTLAHELAHIVSTGFDQIEREVDAEDCETIHNGHGCYFADAYLVDWIDTFWSEGSFLAIPPSQTAGEERCKTDAGFLGPYAATNPQEDFAETFSAFLFSETADNDAIQAKFDWFADQPELADIRDRVADAGFEPIEDFFERCG